MPVPLQNKRRLKRDMLLYLLTLLCFLDFLSAFINIFGNWPLVFCVRFGGSMAVTMKGTILWVHYGTFPGMNLPMF